MLLYEMLIRLYVYVWLLYRVQEKFGATYVTGRAGVFWSSGATGAGTGGWLEGDTPHSVMR
jgi:hypothetical protein